MDINKHERRVKFDNGNVIFLKDSFNIWLLDKIQKGIEDIQNGAKNATLELQLNELTTIRRMLVLDDLSVELSRENMLEGIQIAQEKRNK